MYYSMFEPYAVKNSPIPNRDGTSDIYALLNLRDYKVRGDWSGPARQWGDRQSRCCFIRVPHR